jgi:bacillithiol synthase
MSRLNIPLSDTGYFNRLTLDLIAGEDGLRPFLGQPHSVEAYGRKMQERAALAIDREVLADSLLAQYEAIGGAKDKVLDNIQALRDVKTFTVTTGHQLNIFTGPLYFLYKILHAIRLAEELRKSFPDNRFVPVYWMASEDHDLAEVSFLHLFGKMYDWKTEQTGAVGRMATDGLAALADQLAEFFPTQPQALEAIALFRKAYAECATLADATRQFTDALFGQYGLVIIDADRPELKALFVDVMLRDAMEGVSFQAVNDTNRRLHELGYPAQVNPREVNLFYMQQGLRERIVRTDAGFHALHTDIRWSEEALRAEMTAHPDRFSPNVVLRPQFQERILPNLAYIGGAGELSYWVQLKQAFDSNAASFPILVLRNHLLLIDGGTAKRMDSLGLMVHDLFQPIDELVRAHVLGTSGADLDLTHEFRLMQQLYDALKAKAADIDRTLVAALDAELAKQQKALEQWNGRFARELKKKNETAVQQVQKLHAKLFPGGALQERHDNMLQHLNAFEGGLIARLHEAIEPFGTEFGVLRG